MDWRKINILWSWSYWASHWKNYWTRIRGNSRSAQFCRLVYKLLTGWKLYTRRGSYIEISKRIISWSARMANAILSTLLISDWRKGTLIPKLACIFLIKMGNHWWVRLDTRVLLHIKGSNKAEKMIYSHWDFCCFILGEGNCHGKACRSKTKWKNMRK